MYDTESIDYKRASERRNTCFEGICHSVLEISFGPLRLMSCKTLGPSRAVEPLGGNILDRKPGRCTSTSTPPPGFRFTFTKSKTFTDQFCPVWTVMLPAGEENLFHLLNDTAPTEMIIWLPVIYVFIIWLFTVDWKGWFVVLFYDTLSTAEHYAATDFLWQVDYFLCFDEVGWSPTLRRCISSADGLLWTGKTMT